MTTEVFACHDGLDDLTGLRSKEAFFAAASAYLQRPDVRDANIVCFDVDHFKLLNDLHGLEMGDRLLAYLGRAFKERFSPDDAFPLGRLAWTPSCAPAYTAWRTPPPPSASCAIARSSRSAR